MTQFRQSKCPNCGAPMNPLVNNEVYCSYCGSRFIREEQPALPLPNCQHDHAAQDPKVVLIRDKRAIPPRPQFSGCFSVILLVSFWPVGVAYIIIMLGKRAEWDRQFGNYNQKK